MVWATSAILRVQCQFTAELRFFWLGFFLHVIRSSCFHHSWFTCKSGTLPLWGWNRGRKIRAMGRNINCHFLWYAIYSLSRTKCDWSYRIFPISIHFLKKKNAEKMRKFFWWRRAKREKEFLLQFIRFGWSAQYPHCEQSTQLFFFCSEFSFSHPSHFGRSVSLWVWFPFFFPFARFGAFISTYI